MSSSENHRPYRGGIEGRTCLNTRFVCPECACWVYRLPRGGVIRVRSGTLDDTSWLRPTRHIWTGSKQPSDDQHRLVLMLNGITTAGYSEPWLL